MSIEYNNSYYGLYDMTEEELRSLLTMIKGAGLQERRIFNSVKTQIESILSVKEKEKSIAISCVEPIVQLKPGAILKKRLRKEDFNSRVWCTFKLLNIETLGDILQVSEKFYLSQRNFGRGSLNVIKLYLKQYGYSLKEK